MQYLNIPLFDGLISTVPPLVNLYWININQSDWTEINIPLKGRKVNEVKIWETKSDEKCQNLNSLHQIYF